VLVWVLGTVALVSPAALWGYVHYWLPRKAQISITAERVTPKDSEAVSYLLFYLFPFLDVSLQSLSESAPIILLLIVMSIIYINSNMMYVNPMLNLFGYHIFEIENEDGKIYGLISRDKYIRPGTSFLVHPSQNYVALKTE